MKDLRQASLFAVFLLTISLQAGFFLLFFGIIPAQEYSIELGTQETYITLIFTSLSIILTSLLYFVARIYFANPIRILRTEIAYFLAGITDKKRIDTTSFTADSAYVISFFYRSLDILRNFKEEFQSGRILRSEVELASDIQKHVLKKSYPKTEMLEIVADTKSATEVGWDSYDIITQGANTYIYLWDVTGHGVASGFVMMVVNALVSGFAKMLVNGASILAQTNEILKPRVKSNMLMTVLMVRWNEIDKKLYMTGAGHEYLLVYKKKENKVHAIKSGGVALGMTRDISKVLKEVQISFEPGDCLVLYTDGITEARNGPQEKDIMFGVDRLVQTVQDCPVKTSHGIFKHITIELSKFMGYKYRQFDDITLIVVRYREDWETESSETRDLPAESVTEWNWH
jgi:serine phosphatase RsbU (regulator of sigma subunit)